MSMAVLDQSLHVNPYRFLATWGNWGLDIRHGSFPGHFYCSWQILLQRIWDVFFGVWAGAWRIGGQARAQHAWQGPDEEVRSHATWKDNDLFRFYGGPYHVDFQMVMKIHIVEETLHATTSGSMPTIRNWCPETIWPVKSSQSWLSLCFRPLAHVRPGRRAEGRRFVLLLSVQGLGGGAAWELNQWEINAPLPPWWCLGHFWVMSNPSQCVWLPKKVALAYNLLDCPLVHSTLS